MPDEFLTVYVYEVAELLKMNAQTIRNWIDQGKLPAVRVGPRRVRIKQADLDRFLKAGEIVEAPAEPERDEEHTAVFDAAAKGPEAVLAALADHEPEESRALLDDVISDLVVELNRALDGGGDLYGLDGAEFLQRHGALWAAKLRNS
jgi:excisionase family DNA binding protein